MIRELFITAMYAALRMYYAIDRFDKLGFDIERGLYSASSPGGHSILRCGTL